MKKNYEFLNIRIQGLDIVQRNDMQSITLDSILLSDFIKVNRNTKNVLDIGTGNGIISLLLNNRSNTNIYGIEINEITYNLALENIKRNNIHNISFINDDIRNYSKYFKNDFFDVIFSNPPYFKFDGNINQLNKTKELSIARHEVDISMEEIIKISSNLLKNNGTFSIIFRTDRLAEMMVILKKYRLTPKRLRLIFTNNEKSKISLIECIKNANDGLIVETPLFVYIDGRKNEYINHLYRKELNET